MHASVTVNGVPITVNAAVTVLQLCNLLGIYIPRFCYHEKLSIAGSCRMCLVEMHKAFKPIVACATPLLTGMTIRTETALIKNSREHILEFLLINHPLDCPICDQGGECDLQDQALIYGSDRGRFKERKRSVSDKNFGPFIKTTMTRCIHCTRCVRFMSEIASDNILGTLGRGKDVEIGTYVAKQINSEISGNIIDICPVGALTSKPFAFAARSWELRSVESIDIFDSLGSSVRLDFRGSEIIRILPKTNESINEQWISNKVRFAYDGFKHQRITMPLVRKNKWRITNISAEYSFANVSWERIMRLTSVVLLYYLVVYGCPSINFNIGKLVDLNSVCSLSRVIQLLGLQYIIDQTAQLNSHNIDFRENYVLNRPIVHFERSGTYIFLGLNLQVDAPLLGTRLLKKIRTKNKKKLISFFGSFLKNLYFGKQLGVHTGNLVRIVEGRHSFCRVLFNSRDICWITNNYNANTSFFLLNMFPHAINRAHSVSILHDNCIQVGLLDLGLTCTNTELYKNLGTKNNKNTFYYSVGNECLNIPINSYVVYQGHHSISNSMETSSLNIILPSSTFIEKTRFYVNAEGRLLSTRKATTPPGFAKEDLDIINVLGSLFKLNTTRDLSHMILKLLTPHLFKNLKWRLSYIYSLIWYKYYVLYMTNINILGILGIYNYIYAYAIDNYYSTNAITNASKILSRYIMVFSNYAHTY